MNVEIQCFTNFEVIAILALSQKVKKRVGDQDFTVAWFPSVLRVVCGPSLRSSSSIAQARLSLRCHLGWIRRGDRLELPEGRESLANMGKVPVRLKEVVYTLSPYRQQVMASLWKDIPYKLGKKFHENWVSAFTLVVPIAGTYMYAENYREQEKLHHRY